MAHRFPVPDETQLERLVVSVYENLPVAEIARMNRIEERLSRKLATGKPKLQRDVNKIPWWIVILLTGGIAAATWWAGNRYNDVIKVNDNDVTNVKDKALPLPQAVGPGRHDSREQAHDSQHAESDRQGSPIIYQREP